MNKKMYNTPELQTFEDLEEDVLTVSQDEGEDTFVLDDEIF